MRTFWNVHQRRVTLCAFCALTLLTIELSVRRFATVLRGYDVALYRRAQDGLAHANHADLVLMGSSRVRFGLDPSVFQEVLGGCRAYNVALSGSKIVEWSVLSRRIFDGYTPRVVVLGINASEVRCDYVPTEAARQVFDFGDFVESLKTEGPSLSVAGAYAQRVMAPWWKTYELRYEILLWGQEHLGAVLPKHAQLAMEVRERAATPRPPNGYTHPWSQGRRLKNLHQKLMEDYAAELEVSVPQYRPDGSTFVRLRNLLHELQSRGIAVVVVYMPNSPRTEERWKGIEPRMMQRIARICDERGVAFLHWDRTQLPRRDEDFMDETHVGWPLAKEISRRVAEQIDALALLNGVGPEKGSQVAATEERP